jgi:SagB-type dehydrogenase family enzyme
MTEQQLSNILFYTLGETDPSALEGRGRRAYASAGARYPLEAYVLLFERVGAHDPGVYHYALEAHGLTRIRHDALSDQDIDRYFRYPETKRASCAVVLTAVFHRASIKYGERSYRHVLLEAGGVGEQAYLVAGAEGVGCVVMSGYQDDALERLLDIDGVTESVVSTIVFG